MGDQNGKAFSCQGKSRGILKRMRKLGKITQNTEKLREFRTNVIYYFSDLITVKEQNIKKILEKS